MAKITRLGLWGHDTRLDSSFTGKPAGTHPHPVGKITRLGMWGHNTRRCGSFAGKTPFVPLPVVPSDESGVGKHGKIKRRTIRLSDLPPEARQTTADFIKARLGEYGEQPEVKAPTRKKYIAKFNAQDEARLVMEAKARADQRLLDENNDLLKLIILSSMQ